MTTTDRLHPEPERFIAQQPADVLAAVPIVLGFVPEESVVMLTSGATEPFHARLDLPGDSQEDRREVADALAMPAVRHGVRQVLFVLYTPDADTARDCARTLLETFTEAAIEVVEVLRSDGCDWFVVPLDGATPEGPGTPYDLAIHPFTARGVVAGRVVRGSRAELAATVAADPEAAREVDAALDRALPPSADEWVREVVSDLVCAGRPPDPVTTARLLVALRRGSARDVVLLAADRDAAVGALDAWAALVRAAPPAVVAPAASVLAFLAWLAGDGALAWCALERAEEGERACSLADVVGELLERAVPPSSWRPGDEVGR